VQKGTIMAPKPTTTVPATEAKPETQDTQQAANGTAPEFDWSAMAAPVAMPTKATVSPAVANVLETIPEPIRHRAEASLHLNTVAKAAKANSTARRARVQYHWDFQPVADDKMAMAFTKLMSKYAKYRPNVQEIPYADITSPRGQITARIGDPGWFVLTEDQGFVQCQATEPNAVYGLRYSVRPFEQRQDTARLPGTA
jgi:hypothetical protein